MKYEKAIMLHNHCSSEDSKYLSVIEPGKWWVTVPGRNDVKVMTEQIALFTTQWYICMVD